MQFAPLSITVGSLVFSSRILERDGLPLGHVGQAVDPAFVEIDESGHADAEGGDSGVSCPQLLDDADHGVDQAPGSSNSCVAIGGAWSMMWL